MAVGEEEVGAVVVDRHSGHHLPVAGPGCEVQLDVEFTVDAGERAQQEVGGREADIVAAFTLAEREHVDQDPAPARALERGLEHQRAGAVAAGDVDDVARSKAPVAGPIVEKAGEHRRRVEPGETQPFDRSVAGHQAAEWQSDSNA